MPVFFCLTVVASFGWAEPATVASSDDEQRQAEKLEFDEWAAKAAAAYEIRQAASPGTPLRLRSVPVLKWSNPERGRIYGHVFIWTADGRPEAIASLYKWYHPFTHSSHEFQSLSLGGLTARREGSVAWSTTRRGVELRPLAEAPPPAKAAPERLRQMRMLVRRFRAEETNREGERAQLRLLTQPIYQYESTAASLLDGALFAFVQATDPEIFLMLEVRLDESGNESWQYGLARMNSVALRAFYDDREVWSAAELSWSAVRDQSGPYFSVQFR